MVALSDWHAVTTFHYLPPHPDEQRGFLLQGLGTLLGLIVVVLLSVYGPHTDARYLLWGGEAGAVWMLARSIRGLELKAQRARTAFIGIDDDGIHQDGGRFIPWSSITSCTVEASKLVVTWSEGELSFGGREIDDGGTLIREIVQRHARVAGPAAPPSNFIALDPR